MLRNRSSNIQPKFLEKLVLIDLENPFSYDLPCDGYRFPGIIDMHLHGAFGWDFSFGNPDKIDKMLNGLIEHGLTGVLATVITCSEEKRLEALTDIRAVALRRRRPPMILGIYLEGPFISMAKKGSHSADFLINPDIKALERWQLAAGGLIKLITIAPELPNACELIKAACDMGITCAVGHTDAGHAATISAFRAGATHVTHLYNAMRPFTHREPSAVSAVFETVNLSVELIPDGIHVAPEILRMTTARLGAINICWISDGTALTGLPDGRYDIYDCPVHLDRQRCSLDGGRLFGGAKTLLSCFPLLRDEIGIHMRHICSGVSENPCRAIGLPLPAADVILDTDLKWRCTRLGSQWFWQESD